MLYWRLYIEVIFQYFGRRISKAHWFQNILIINLWQHLIEGDREFKTMGIISGALRNTNACYQNFNLIKGWIHSERLRTKYLWKSVSEGLPLIHTFTLGIGK